MLFIFLQMDQKLIVHFPAATAEFYIGLIFLGKSVDSEVAF